METTTKWALFATVVSVLMAGALLVAADAMDCETAAGHDDRWTTKECAIIASAFAFTLVFIYGFTLVALIVMAANAYRRCRRRRITVLADDGTAV